jgi:hypothetical protein
MIYLILGVLLIVLSSAAYGPPVLRAARAFYNLAGSLKRLCPETGCTAWIHINISRAACTVLTSGLADIQVKNCTRWPERRGCGQACIAGMNELGSYEEIGSRLPESESG